MVCLNTRLKDCKFEYKQGNLYKTVTLNTAAMMAVFTFTYGIVTEQ